MTINDVTATVIEEDMCKADPLAAAIDRAIFLRTNDKVKIKIDRLCCVGYFECSAEVAKINNPLILNGSGKYTVRKPVENLQVGDKVEFKIWY